MNFDALARFVAIVTITVSFALGARTLGLHPTRSEVIELVALDDGTALITQMGDAGSFLSRMKPDGTRMWAARVPGKVRAHSIASNAQRIAVRYEAGKSCGIATYSEDGELQWQHELSTKERGWYCDSPLLANAVFAGEIVAVFQPSEIIGLSAADGSERWRTPRATEMGASLAADGTIMLETFHGELFLDPRTGATHERRGCQLGTEHLVMHSGGGADQVFGDRGFAATLPFSSDARVGSVLAACATYRDQIALLVTRLGAEPETRLVLLSRSGHVVADHHLPVTQTDGRDTLGFVPPSRLAFTGEIPRILPLVERSGYYTAALLVDVETGEVIARSEASEMNVHALRDGEAVYFIQDFNDSLLELAPGGHALRVRAAKEHGRFDAAQVAGGYIWTFEEGTSEINPPPITATPAPRRRASGASTRSPARAALRAPPCAR